MRSQTGASQEAPVFFTNPQEFLEVLRKNYNSIASSPENGMTKEDLLDFSETTDSPSGRKAAKIAYQHFDELEKFNNLYDSLLPDRWLGRNHKGIFLSDLHKDLDIYNGKTDLYVKHDQIEGAVYGLEGAGFSALSNQLIFPDFPPISILAAGVALTATVASVDCFKMVSWTAGLRSTAGEQSTEQPEPRRRCPCNHIKRNDIVFGI